MQILNKDVLILVKFLYFVISSWLKNNPDKTQSQIFTFAVIEDTSGLGVLVNTGFSQLKGLFPSSFVLGHLLGYLFSKHWLVDKDSLCREVSTLIKICKTEVCTGGPVFSQFLDLKLGIVVHTFTTNSLVADVGWLLPTQAIIYKKTRERSLSVGSARVVTSNDVFTAVTLPIKQTNKNLTYPTENGGDTWNTSIWEAEAVGWEKRVQVILG